MDKEKNKARLLSDINLMLFTTDAYQIVCPKGYELFMNSFDQSMKSICNDLLNDKGFTKENPLLFVDQEKLFELFMCLERNVHSKQTHLEQISNGDIILVLSVSNSKIGIEDNVYIYNKVKLKGYKHKFYFHLHQQ
jgi:hypothetical protein